jgi:uncharacterized surface protein with fasciclin (FAS1) repeats
MPPSFQQLMASFIDAQPMGIIMKNLIALLLIAGLGSASCGGAPAAPDTDKMQAEADAAAAEEQAKAQEEALAKAEADAKAAMTLDIVDTALAAGTFTTLAQALTAAELIETLKGPGPFTVFAPTDAAFAKLDAETLASLLTPEGKEKLKAILTYHVLSDKVMAADAVAGEVATVNGAKATIAANEDGTMTYSGATITTTDINCTNGVIHVIDTVVMPPAPAKAKK